MIETLWYPLDGRRHPLSWPLIVPEAFFRTGVALKNLSYERGWLKPARVGAKVISVGNVTVGGAGKTPVVIELARRLVALGKRVAVISRGYGRRTSRELSFGAGDLPSADDCGDEPRLIAAAVPQAQLYVGADRVALAQRAAERGFTHLLLDDGMQHRRLARDVDIAVVDGSVGLGTGALLPRGPLREPASALRRASFIWLREGDKTVPLPPGVPVVRARHLPVALRDPEGTEKPLDALRGRPVVAFAGIARPSAFFATARQLGLSLEAARAFPDHHRYSADDLAQLQSPHAERLTTDKDRARLPEGFGVWSIVLGIELLDGEAELMRALV